MQSRMLFPSDKEEFKPTRINTINENQNHHYCGECKGDFYDIT